MGRSNVRGEVVGASEVEVGEIRLGSETLSEVSEVRRGCRVCTAER